MPTPRARQRLTQSWGDPAGLNAQRDLHLALGPQPTTFPPTPGYQQCGWGQKQPAGPEVEAWFEAQHHVDVSAEPLDACTGEEKGCPCDWSHRCL